MPECECHTTIFATGNNILLKGDMVRRGLLCNLDTLSERPELRKFRHDPLSRVLNDRGAYVTAGLTIVRAYLAAGAPQVCPQIGSYGDWSRLARAPLVWLDQPDPVLSMDTARDEDPELNDVRELFTLWIEYLDLNQPYTTSRIIEVACETRPNDFNRQPFKELLARVAGNDDGISARRLGWWLRRISGRVIDGHRLVQGRLNTALVNFSLLRV
jgi:putative DNA primase/helicase